MPSTRTISGTCLSCLEQFFPLRAEVRRGKGKFCSKQCADNWQSKIRTVGEGSKSRKNLMRRQRRRDPNLCLIERARDSVKRAVESGLLCKKSCIVCGECKTEAHHHDYTKPLDVEWLCQKHHREVDLKMGVRVI